MKAYRVLLMFLAVGMLVSACNLPSAQPTQQNNPNAVFTQAALTVVAELTKSAVQKPTDVPPTVQPPTNTPEAPTNTPEPAASVATATTAPAAPVALCDSAIFVADITVPDGTAYSAGATFTKTWQLKNSGTCTWNSSYALVFDSGSQMGGASSIPLAGTIAPGQTLNVSVNLQAPATDGTYSGFWGLTNGSGARIPVGGGFSGRSFSVIIKVGSGGAADFGSGKFAVTSVGFSVDSSGACSSRKYTITASVKANKAGDVNYTWIRSDGATGSTMSGTLNFGDAGTQTITFEWTFGGGGQWVDLYIDKPNHQQFGRATLNCP